MRFARFWTMILDVQVNILISSILNAGLLLTRLPSVLGYLGDFWFPETFEISGRPWQLPLGLGNLGKIIAKTQKLSQKFHDVKRWVEVFRAQKPVVHVVLVDILQVQ